MLDWIEHADGWHADGFRIELVEPFRWFVIDRSAQDHASVSLGVQPLAIERTLTEAKREAELLAASRRRSDLRRRHILTLLVVLSTSVFLAATSPGGNAAVVIGGAFLATRSAMFLLGSFLPTALGERHQTFYQ